MSSLLIIRGTRGFQSLSRVKTIEIALRTNNASACLSTTTTTTTTARTDDQVLSALESFKLENQVAIVTGAGAGIGRGIAELFAKAGASVVVSDLKKETAAAVADTIQARGGKAIAVACNVTQNDDLEHLVTSAVDAFGKITLLVNNAGGGGPKPFDMDMDTFIWAYKLNVFSVFHLCQLCAPHMEKAAGNGSSAAILNISSMAAENKNKLQSCNQSLDSQCCF